MGPLGKRVLGWLFGAEAAAAKAVLKQLELSNLLSYSAVDDIMSTGMVLLLRLPLPCATCHPGAVNAPHQ